MKEINDEKAAGYEAVWPPPPTDQVEDVGADTAWHTSRRYLTNHAWLDTIVGIGIGLIFYWIVFYAVATYILYYLIPHRVDFFWNVVAACIIALLASLLLWIRLRIFYRRLALTILFACAIEGIVLMYAFHLGT